MTKQHRVKKLWERYGKKIAGKEIEREEVKPAADDYEFESRLPHELHARLVFGCDGCRVRAFGSSGMARLVRNSS